MKIKWCFILILFFEILHLNAESRTVRIGIFPAPPLVIDKANKPEGLFIDLIEYFSITLDWKIEYVNGTWSELLASLEKGEIDLLPAVGYTTERVAKYDFNRNSIYIDSGVLFTNPKITLHTIFDLQGKKVAAVRGSIFTIGFINYISSFGVNCEIVYKDDNRAVMEAVSNGTVDVGVCIYSLGNELAKEYSVTITSISFSPVALYFATPKGKNHDLIEDIDLLMGKMIGNPDSLYSQSYNKWTMPQPLNKLPVWFLWGLVGFYFIGFLLGLWNYFLNRQVNLKTKHLEVEISERKFAEEKIKKSLSEKETLIRELYHRTKNTMQVIRGMLVLQAEEYPSIDEVQLLVKNTEDRIQVISLVHQMLYRSKDLSHISIKEYIIELSSLILESFDISVSINVKIEEKSFLLDTAIPLGLILNELMTNSLKYAFPQNRKGTISIYLTGEKSDIYKLQYFDDGVGVPEGFDFRSQNTLGLKLIYSIGEMQMLGNVNFENNNGVRCELEFSTALYEARV